MVSVAEVRIDPDSAEVAFAQKLASCEPTVRARALRRLRSWMRQRKTQGDGLGRDELLKLWKGLYYSLWMQDKPLVQEELIDGLVELGGEMGGGFGRRLLYVGVGLETVAREWALLDRWRVDKFLLLLRRLFRSALASLAKAHAWKPKPLRILLDLLGQQLTNPQRDACDETLRMHFAAMFLDEVDLAAKTRPVDSPTLVALLGPYVRLLGNKKTSELLFKAASKEVFHSLLTLASAEMAQKVDGESGEEEEEEAAGLVVDYAAVAEALMSVGKAAGLKGRRRAEVYELVRKLRLAAQGLDPLEEADELDGAASDLDEDEEIERAAIKLAAHLGKVPKKRKAQPNLTVQHPEPKKAKKTPKKAKPSSSKKSPKAKSPKLQKKSTPSKKGTKTGKKSPKPLKH